MIVFPNAKINLGLHILRRREDGYHDLETVLIPVALADMLEIIPCREGEKPEFIETGILSGVPSAQNLCMKAVQKMGERVNIPPLKIALHKQIPNGAGLGGGSVDAAFSLVLLNNIFEFGFSTDQLADMASEIGSDCPFFIYNNTMLASGRGEILEEISLNHGNFRIVLVKPPFSFDTRSAYQSVTIRDHHISLKEIIRLPVSEWRHHLVNDFEEIDDSNHQVIKYIKQKMYDAGALYTSMTGSGSAVFGLFTENPESLVWPADYFVWRGTIDLNAGHY